jgi:hypothetical protein
VQSRRRLLIAGALFGLAVCLRFQYAPPLVLAALWQHGSSRRRVALVGGSALGVVVLAAGVLDAATWGTPFQSIWLNFRYNAIDGVTAAMGAWPWWYFGGYHLVAWGVAAPVILILMAAGARRAPALAIAAVTTVLLHSLSPHKELRFIYLAMAGFAILTGLGAALYRRLSSETTQAKAVMLTAALAVSVTATEAWSAATRATSRYAWYTDRSLIQALEAAREQPGLCGLGVQFYWVYRADGYTYLHRDVPIYYASFERAQHIPHSPFPMRFTLRVLLRGAAVPQFPDAAFPRAADRFNVMIGRESDSLAGFHRVACFGGVDFADAPVCLFRRPGPCVEFRQSDRDQP